MGRVAAIRGLAGAVGERRGAVRPIRLVGTAPSAQCYEQRYSTLHPLVHEHGSPPTTVC